VNDQDAKIHVGRSTRLMFGILAALIAVALMVFSLAIFFKSGGAAVLGSRMGVTLLSMSGSFALFFSVVAWRALSVGKDSGELMSTVRWRGLAASMLVVALLTVVFGHWVGALVPTFIGFFCLFKDPWFRELLNVIS
jgi:hypothetical protein